MAKQPFISHVVNGYSRYDVPESKAFSCTPGILYPVRIDFINARDRVTINQGIDVRSNPLAVPTFNPYTVRLHRFWVPMQLYHPEMRTNSSKFDMNNVSINWIPSFIPSANSNAKTLGVNTSFQNSLMHWLRIGNSNRLIWSSFTNADYGGIELPAVSSTNGYNGGAWSNADTYLAYWDIVRNYYSYSQWSLFSIATPASWKLIGEGSSAISVDYAETARYFTQGFCNLQYLDAFYESQFYPSSVTSSNNTYNRSNLYSQIIFSDIDNASAQTGDGYPVSSNRPYASGSVGVSGQVPVSQFDISGSPDGSGNLGVYFTIAHPMAVVPSTPDRFSRLIPYSGTDDAVSMTGVQNIPQLAVASRLQEYKDLLGAGGSRFSDWLETFFASKIDHVDRPKLLFSASCTVNAQVVMNQSGNNMFENSTPLGAQGGSIAFNSKLGRSQSYYFREPGYMIDMFSIRPVYYWSGIRPDYLDYEGSDYFNPIYNDIGYQSVPASRFGNVLATNYGVSSEPCFNEFRSSYDEALGALCVPVGQVGGYSLYSYWVQQRSFNPSYTNGIANRLSAYSAFLFTDLTTVNSPFASNVEDNFFVNLSYSVRKKNLVNKTFATRLSNR